jgi:hypothetical protein
MKDEDLERIRFVTLHFGELKGLQGAVPSGLWLLGMGFATLLCKSYSYTTAAVISGFLFVWAVGAGVLYLSLRAGKYYRRTYGEVEQRRQASALFGASRKSVVIAATALVLALVIMRPWDIAVKEGRHFYLLSGCTLLGVCAAERKPPQFGGYQDLLKA